MTLRTAIGVLVAVAVPLWLVVEQVLTWTALGPGTSATPAGAKTRRMSKAHTRGWRVGVIGAARHRKTS